MKVPFLDLGWQHRIIQEKLRNRFEDIFARTAFVAGPDVEAFETHFAQYLGTRFAVGVASGTDALYLALQACGIGTGDIVVTIPTTFVATVSEITRVGARPLFVDIDPDTRDFNYAVLENAVTLPGVRAIMPVHMYGFACDMDKVMRIAGKYNLKVIEDAAQAHGATYKGKKAGTFGDAGIFSFYPGKNLGAYGDGGMVVTNDEGIATHVKELRNHGGIAKYTHRILGGNSRLDTLQAAVLDEKLKHLDDWNEHRQSIASMYGVGFAFLREVKVFHPLSNTEAIYHLYAIGVRAEERDELMRHLATKGIETGVHYPKPLHLLQPFADLGYREGEFPVAEEYCKTAVSLPMFPGMTDEQVHYVIDAVHEFFAGKDKKQ